MICQKIRVNLDLGVLILGFGSWSFDFGSWSLILDFGVLNLFLDLGVLILGELGLYLSSHGLWEVVEGIAM